jgi:1-deoxy-D-xylulose-5-phosphate synthase
MKHDLLPDIHDPEDLRALGEWQLPQLATEIRRLIMAVVSRNGGHLASNLGVVELTIALHRVFHSPRDLIVWDVGHQCYAHKILTGRADAFPSLRTQGGISGFPSPEESRHDPAQTGHASTAISFGLGVLTGRRMRGEEGKVVAVVGDGALTGGLAFAGLNNAGHAGRDLVIILNDNAMSIGRNVGALSTYLGRLTMSRFYQVFRRRFDRTVGGLPVIGPEMMRYVTRLKKAAKAWFFRETMFADLGFEYVGPVDGHDIHGLIRILRTVRDVPRPVVVHVTTRKGKGYTLAEDDPTRFHGTKPFSLLDGSVEESTKLTFSEAFSQAMSELAEEDPALVGITAAMTDGTGLRPMAGRFPARVFDVGIAEDHAVTFAAGLALAGMHPVVAMYSTFLQRAVDQIIHDVALSRLPVVFAVDRAGFVSGDGKTHQGIFDVALTGCVPGLALLAPASRGELALCLRWAVGHGGPVMIRYPKAVCGPEVPDLDFPIEEGRGVFLRRLRSEVLMVNVGALMPQCLAAAHILNLAGISTDIYNLRFIKPLDADHLIAVLRPYRFVVTVEEAVLRGGAGEQIGRLAREAGMEGMRLLSLGVADEFPVVGTRDQLLEAAGLDGPGIARRVRELCEGETAAVKRAPLGHPA